MRNPIYEQVLKRNGLEFKYVDDLRLTLIDVPRSMHNQARIAKPIDDELVATYELGYRSGAHFPPLVVYLPRPKGKYVLMDGIQRFTAAIKAGRHVHDVYDVDCTDPQVIDRVTWTFNNAVNGKRLSPEESLVHAVSYVMKYGVSQELTAKDWGVSLWKIQRRIRELKLREVLDRQNVRGASRLSQDQINELSPLLPSGEDIIAATAKVVLESGLSGRDLSPLVDRIKGAPTGTAKLETIDDFRKSQKFKEVRAQTKGGTIRIRRPRPVDRLATLIR